MHNKAQIREARLARRDAMPAPERVRKSAAVRAHLRSLTAFTEAPEVGCYVSKGSEVDTHLLIAELLGEGRRVAVPIANAEGTLRWSPLERFEDLEPGAFGVLEPRRGQQTPVNFSADSVVLVPCTAFEPQGQRLGYGKGYFDRFLATYEGKAIGLAFELQQVHELPVEDHDIPLGVIVTEERVYGSPKL